MVADRLHAFSKEKNVIASTSVAIPAQADLEVVLLLAPSQVGRWQRRMV